MEVYKTLRKTIVFPSKHHDDQRVSLESSSFGSDIFRAACILGVGAVLLLSPKERHSKAGIVKESLTNKIERIYDSK